MSDSKKNILKSSALITLILVISKVTGLLRELLLASQFGASNESDIYKAATKIPNLFFNCVAAALVVSFIPVFSGIKDDKEKADKFFNNLVNILFLICSILSVIGIVFSPQLTRLFAMGFTGNKFLSTSSMTKIVMPAIIFLSLSGLFTGYLQSYGKFVPAAMTDTIANCILIAAILFLGKYGIIVLIVAFLISAAAQMFFQIPFMNGYKYRFYINFKDQNVKRMLILSVPILISTAVGQINTIVDSTFVSNLAPGSMSIVDYASKLSSVVNQVFIVAITTVLYPMLTEKASKNDHEGFKDLTIRSMNIIFIVVVPMIFGLITLSTPLVKVFLQHGKFDSHDTYLTSMCLKCLAISAIGYSLIDILGKVFFSIKDTVTPMVNGFITIGLNILIIIILVPRIGILGSAIATTTSSCLISLIMLFELKHKIKDLKFSKTAGVLIKAIFGGIIMAIVVYLSYKYANSLLPKDTTIFLIVKITITTLLGILTYFGMMVALRVDEFEILYRNKLKKII